MNTKWTLSILKSVREKCIACADRGKQELALICLCKDYPTFPKERYENKKIRFTDEEYLTLRNMARRKKLSYELIHRFDDSFDHAFSLAHRSVTTGFFGSAIAGMGFEANVCNYIYLAYYIDWVDEKTVLPQDYEPRIQVYTVLNKSVTHPDTALVRLGISST